MPPNSIEEALQRVVDSHGYGFHYAVIRAVDNLSSASPWRFQSAEVPVSVRSQDTRIDFVLRHNEAPIFLICECKRANPALRNWCFLRAPYVKRNHLRGELIFEGVKDMEAVGPVKLVTDRTYFGFSQSVYDIALEIRGQEKGDTAGTGRGEVETAATQVCKGLNGFVEFLSHNHEIIWPDRWRGKVAFLVPVIFTTASILTSETNLGDADIATGKLPETPGIDESPWLWYRYHQSPGLRHGLEVSPGLFRNGEPDWRQDVGHVMERNSARTIAVVNAAGIENFLRSLWFEWKE